MAPFTKGVNPRLAKRPLKTNGCLANRRLTSLVKGATGNKTVAPLWPYSYEDLDMQHCGLLILQQFVWSDIMGAISILHMISYYKISGVSAIAKIGSYSATLENGLKS